MDEGFAELFEALCGKWTLKRRADDGSLFVGTARFERLAARRFLLQETGEFVLPGQEPRQAGRQWVWRLARDGFLEVRFSPAEGERLYHRFRPAPAGGAWAGQAEHLCGADLYRADYRFAKDRMEVLHRVAGPAKNYRLTGIFERTQDG